MVEGKPPGIVEGNPPGIIPGIPFIPRAAPIGWWQHPIPGDIPPCIEPMSAIIICIICIIINIELIPLMFVPPIGAIQGLKVIAILSSPAAKSLIVEYAGRVKGAFKKR